MDNSVQSVSISFSLLPWIQHAHMMLRDSFNNFCVLKWDFQLPISRQMWRGLKWFLFLFSFHKKFFAFLTFKLKVYINSSFKEKGISTIFLVLSSSSFFNLFSYDCSSCFVFFFLFHKYFGISCSMIDQWCSDIWMKSHLIVEMIS